MSEDIDRIVRGLTKAQKAYLTTKAEWKKPACWAQERWMTFPPAGVHRVLMRLCLVSKAGSLLGLGLAVRARLEDGEAVG